ncbi:non-specific lipid transfer protein GPI-anchored 20 [Ziziphus jujuba]|uniref:Non-specific lipid transfer protein GPI-anchored 20 n=2 Tax=Ziziphus jujuba TaxID=326968 RepID=A0A6P3YZY9_ZIZJJ|nr:non-specific lipid transfer protein GPI-anchored 20 [Ziziphus jujuba]KAH7522290.1 hypothetical protein FEM48_Zijuj07G0122600 [Ziziphus jujuba var. spinosa]
MEISTPLPRLITVLVAATILLAVPVYGQISTPCNASMLSSFTPCMNFLTNSSSNGTSPSADCCNSLKSATGSGMDCLCLLFTGNVPFQLPINRSLAISLPRACNMPGVPVQCKASGAPIPAPGPASLEPTPSPGDSPSGSSVPEEPNSPSLAPTSDTTPTLTPPSGTGSQTPTGTGAEAPSGTPGIRPVLNPSSALPSYSVSSFVLVFALGILAMKLF